VTLVVAEDAEPADAELFGLLEQMRLVELLVRTGLGQRRRGARDERQMGESNLTPGHRLRALRHVSELLTNRNPIRGRAATHVALMPDPMNRGDGAVEVVLIGGRKRSRHLGELQLEQVHASSKLCEIRRQLVSLLARRLSAKALDARHESKDKR
jgi:hypothetical protein